MRWDVLAVWLLPAFCEDITALARSGEHLTQAGENIATLFVWLLIVGLWMLSVASFVRREKKIVTASVLANGIFAKLNGDEYIMVPADHQMQAEIRKENRRARHIERLKQPAE